MDNENTEQPEQPEKKKDNMSDLFNVDPEDLLDGADDLVTVDMEKDILDADEDGSIDDVTTVTEEDIMGDELYGQSPLDGASAQRRKKALRQQQYQVVRPHTYPSQMREVGE